MDAIALFHTLATLAFVAGSAVVAVRLLALARRTREAPELLLGGAILCTAVLGYGVLIAALAVRGTQPLAPHEVPALGVLLSGAGRTVHDLGVLLFLAFVLRVFRPDALWAKGLAAAMAALLLGGLAVGAMNGSFRVEAVGSAGWFCEYLVIWTYPLWPMLESYRYWRLMRRRAALGMADALVTNRFFLWAAGSAFTALAIWTASVPYALLHDLALLEASTPAVRGLTALFGLASVSCSLIAFLPPAWYRRRIEGVAGAIARERGGA